MKSQLGVRIARLAGPQIGNTDQARITKSRQRFITKVNEYNRGSALRRKGYAILENSKKFVTITGECRGEY